MAEALVIVESPAKAKTINKFLGRGYKVLSSKGHVRDLPKNWRPKDFADASAPPYVILEDREKLIAEILEEALLSSDTSATGVLAALAAQGLALYDSARLGAWLCGRAAERAITHGPESEESLSATRVIARLGEAFRDLREGVF